MERTPLPKSAWGPGPWQDEPDLVAFIHAGLPCRIVRNTWVTGSFCGYVALSPDHPWWGKHYDDCTATPQCEPEPPPNFDDWPKGFPMPPIGSQMRQRMMEPSWICEHRPVAILDAHGGITYGGPAFWPDAEGGLDWGFGFDCAHAGDVSPLMDATMREIYEQMGDDWAARQRIFRDDIYRDLAYVRGEVERLAEQLALVRQTATTGE